MAGHLSDLKAQQLKKGEESLRTDIDIGAPLAEMLMSDEEAASRLIVQATIRIDDLLGRSGFGEDTVEISPLSLDSTVTE